MAGRTAAAKPKPRQTKAPAPIEQTATAPPAQPRHQISIRVDAATLARVDACCADAAFHGGVTVDKPTLLRKALWTYLAAYAAEDHA